MADEDVGQNHKKNEFEDLLRKLLPIGAPLLDESQLDYSISVDYQPPRQKHTLSHNPIIKNTTTPFTTHQNPTQIHFFNLSKSFVISIPFEEKNNTQKQNFEKISIKEVEDFITSHENVFSLRNDKNKKKICNRCESRRHKLGFVDGGLGMDGLMVFGGYQLEDHVLEFNMGINMMGFSSSLWNDKLRESL